MFKKLMIVALVIMTLMTALVPCVMAETYNYRQYATPQTMYVYTENGGTLNVRTVPAIRDNTIIGRIAFGSQVTVVGYDITAPNWLAIRYAAGDNGIAWVMSKFLTSAAPGRTDIDQAAINRQMSTYQSVEKSYLISARPTNQATGWVNFRSLPGMSAPVLTTLKLGQTLTVIGETTDWYRAIDSVTGMTGYVSKTYTVKLLA